MLDGDGGVWPHVVVNAFTGQNLSAAGHGALKRASSTASRLVMKRATKITEDEAIVFTKDILCFIPMNNQSIRVGVHCVHSKE